MKLNQVKVLAKELSKRSLTGKQIEALGIMNYKGRISDLRWHLAGGYMFHLSSHHLITDMVKVKTRWGNSRIAVYSIDKYIKKEYNKWLKGFLK